MNTELFRISETMDTPLVVVKSDAPHVFIKGVSMPENSFEFYHPIEKKIMELLRDAGDEIEIQIELGYLNSMSGKQILQLIRTIKAAHNEVKVLWTYKQDDDLIRIKGEDIKRICPAVAIELMMI